MPMRHPSTCWEEACLGPQRDHHRQRSRQWDEGANLYCGCRRGRVYRESSFCRCWEAVGSLTVVVNLGQVCLRMRLSVFAHVILSTVPIWAAQCARTARARSSIPCGFRVLAALEYIGKRGGGPRAAGEGKPAGCTLMPTTP